MPELPVNGKFSDKMYKEEHDPNYFIVKGNQIVQHAHYSMPLADQKVLASLIRSIKPKQKTLSVKFSTKDYMHMLGMKRSGTTFDGIMHTLYHILNDNFFIQRPDGKYESWVWLDKVIADPNGKGKGNFNVRFKPELKQYLFNQSLKYRTIYKFSDIMLMRSRYSPRLYEIFRSNQSRQKVQKQGLNYSISELKQGLNLMQRDKRTGKVKHDKKGKVLYMYPRFANFNSRVLKPAKHEINMLTEYNVKMKRIRHGRKTVGINVVMIEKNQREKAQRDDVIYCITHHIPRKEWKNWREDTIRGRFRKIHSRRHSNGHTVDGEFHVIHHPDREDPNKRIKVQIPGTHKYVWVRKDSIIEDNQKENQQKATQHQDTQKDSDLLKKYVKQEDVFGNVKIFNPLLDGYVWTDRKSAIGIAHDLEKSSHKPKK